MTAISFQLTASAQSLHRSTAQLLSLLSVMRTRLAPTAGGHNLLSVSPIGYLQTPDGWQLGATGTGEGGEAWALLCADTRMPSTLVRGGPRGVHNTGRGWTQYRESIGMACQAPVEATGYAQPSWGLAVQWGRAILRSVRIRA